MIRIFYSNKKVREILENKQQEIEIAINHKIKLCPAIGTKADKIWVQTPDNEDIAFDRMIAIEKITGIYTKEA